MSVPMYVLDTGPDWTGEQLVAEVRRLRAALEQIATIPEADDGFNPRTMQRLARTALASPAPERRCDGCSGYECEDGCAYPGASAIPVQEPACPPFEFDRYVNGTLMAEGVTIEREATLEDAMRAAARLAYKGPNGEAPVLVYRPAPPAPAGETAVRGPTRDEIEAACAVIYAALVDAAYEAGSEEARKMDTLLSLEPLLKRHMPAALGAAAIARGRQATEPTNPFESGE